MTQSMEGYKVIKKDGTRENYNVEKVISAINKSAARALVTFTDMELDNIRDYVNAQVINQGINEIPIATMHFIVESCLCLRKVCFFSFKPLKW